MKQLHATQMDTLCRCGIQFERRYVKGEIIPPAVAMLVGTATHAGAERNLRHKAETGNLLEIEDALETAVDSLKGNWDASDVRLDEKEQEKGLAVVKGEAIETVVALSTVHAEVVAPNMDPMSPAHVEREFVVDVKGYDYQLVGKIDLQEKNGVVSDIKTKNKSMSQADADGSMQMSAYALATFVLDQTPSPINVRFDVLVKLKKGPEYRPVESTRGKEEMIRFLRRVEQASKVLESGIFTPADPNAWWCSKRFCGYAETCPFWSGRP